jgi:hypothetical protein
LNDFTIQKRLSFVYSSATFSSKQKILQTLKSIDDLDAVLYKALEVDINTDNPWFLYNLLMVLNKSNIHSAKVNAVAHEILDSKDSNLIKLASQILDK